MNDDVRSNAQKVLAATERAQRHLCGSGPAGKRVAAARTSLAGYRDGPGVLSAFVRDACNARTLNGITAALITLEEMARGFAEKPDITVKLRPDANETAHRVMLEATGQAPKTLPPGERADEDKHPEAVARGSKGGKKGGKARAQKLTADELTKAAITAAHARWKKKD